MTVIMQLGVQKLSHTRSLTKKRTSKNRRTHILSDVKRVHIRMISNLVNKSDSPSSGQKENSNDAYTESGSCDRHLVF